MPKAQGKLARQLETEYWPDFVRGFSAACAAAIVCQTTTIPQWSAAHLCSPRDSVGAILTTREGPVNLPSTRSIRIVAAREPIS